ncbi:hypothetical protein, partial [Pseudomonas aeruginosa]|uniref:hypothetical protein n=1 Tax=Pseudomonas aeruginosa TaxID=287 RepID=UPI0020B1642B
RRQLQLCLSDGRYGHGGADDPGLRLRALRRALPWRLVRAPTRDGRGEEQA